MGCDDGPALCRTWRKHRKCKRFSAHSSGVSRSPELCVLPHNFQKWRTVYIHKWMSHNSSRVRDLCRSVQMRASYLTNERRSVGIVGLLSDQVDPIFCDSSSGDETLAFSGTPLDLQTGGWQRRHLWRSNQLWHYKHKIYVYIRLNTGNKRNHSMSDYFFSDIN